MIEYLQPDIDRAKSSWKKMQIRTVSIEQASTEDLAVAAVSARFPATRLAAAAELVARIKNNHSARNMLEKIPVRKLPETHKQK